MSTDADTADARLAGVVAVGPTYRLVALVALGLLTAAYGSVFYHVTDVVGGSELMLATLVGASALGLGAGRLLRERTALLLTVLFLSGGAVVYLLSVPASQRALLSVDRLASDSVALLTGLSVLRLTAANVWALSVVPAPAFLSWYLLGRGRYVPSVAVGGSLLGLVVLTGDAGTVATLVGVVGAAAVVGFGTLARHGGTAAQVDRLAILLAAMILVSATLSTVPATRSNPVLPERTTPTGQASLVDAGDRMEVVGTMRLSPKVQFTVESPEGTYMTTATYDRYTGSGWVRSGDTDPYVGRLRAPPGETRDLRQTVTAETELGSMPAAWRPATVGGLSTSRVRVTDQGTVRPAGTLDPGESYTVTSRVSAADADDLRRAGTDYPDRIADRYTRLPDSTPDRVGERTAEVTADAETPYQKAVAVERHLESTKEYSLTVDRPEGNIADAFLFEMTAGYCTYYATTMVAMLRSEGVPARFVTGYTPGERVDDDERVVRGFDSHAWVQVYVPDVGWVQFDPTPADPRDAAESSRLSEARQIDETGVDTNDSFARTPVSTAEGGGDGANTTPTPGANASDAANLSDAAGNPGPGPDPTVPTGGGPSLPSTETLALVGVAVVGLGATIRRTGADRRALRAVWLRRRGPRRDPDADAVRAFDRLAYLLERQERPRRPAETPRAFVESVTTDDRARRILDAYERARYGDGVDRATADTATDAVGELVRERTLPARLFAD
jgi:transglutaminase-like putative cysteine protease